MSHMVAVKEIAPLQEGMAGIALSVFRTTNVEGIPTGGISVVWETPTGRQVTQEYPADSFVEML